MNKITVIIPNFNGKKYLDVCLTALQRQTFRDFRVILVDNGSSDGSADWVQENHPWVDLIRLDSNRGFTGAVNLGVEASDTEYILLLNNDTEVHPEFVLRMYRGIRRHPDAFSCCAKMVQYHDRGKLDDAGNFYCALGWAYARGKGQPVSRFSREERIFSACAGAAIYRRDLFCELGMLDDEHFAYLEDMDIGYRARIHGYENWYLPKAVVYHVGSGTSGSRYNRFKIRYSSRNNIYMIYKNMPLPQILLNLPLLAAGFGVKLLFFCRKGYGREYAAGIKNGLQLCRKERKVPFSVENLPNYGKIQWELWGNVARRFIER